MCDRIAIIQGGKIRACGTMDELRANADGGRDGARGDLPQAHGRERGARAGRRAGRVTRSCSWSRRARIGHTARARGCVPDPSLLHLLVAEVADGARARRRPASAAAARGCALLGFFGFLFWAFIFGVLYRLLLYFRGVPEIGPLLAGKLLGLHPRRFFSILLLSNIITALSSFFLARDLDLLVSGPVDWLKLYGAKLLETIVHSSWMVVLMAVPMFAAYGVVYDGGLVVPAHRARGVPAVPDHPGGRSAARSRWCS